nr:deoxyribonuclease-1 isoform X5 [Odocoileus virginianus texanus]XP_020770962.1 deoxyribonuclease-1 isoform X5 [Odocoileus virginianus texanus]XP_020770963.1 deoxyribonuclease-1 isoform X5 [Odocoileus virginianus texanus]XP_020770964.1 deoxyribonuclease-1 isoform X5 [Odocoileus virginianus texanus]
MLQDEGHQADRAAAHPGWPAAAGPIPEDSSLQHPHLWGDQDVQRYTLQLHCAGMTQTTTTMWSVSRWAATATRSATSLCSEVKEFAIVPLHSAPSDAVAEINSLYDVYLDVRQKWDLNDIMLMGDFNADCSYVTSSQWSSIRLRTSSTFQWLIPDSADTTATSTNCAYDRIVVAGSLLQSSVVSGSAAPFDFQAAYGLSNEMGPLPSPTATLCLQAPPLSLNPVHPRDSALTGLSLRLPLAFISSNTPSSLQPCRLQTS